MRALLLLVVPTSAAAGYAHDPSLPLHPAEYEALLEFKAAIFKDDGLLKTWVPDANGTVDPCNSWEGVDCNCEKLYPLPVEPHPCPDNEDSLFEGDGYNHVYRLDFGPRKSSNKRLHGVYSPYLGNLTEVRQFYLHVVSATYYEATETRYPIICAGSSVISSMGLLLAFQFILCATFCINFGGKVVQLSP